MLQSLFRNLLAGCRLALFLPVSRQHFRIGAPEYAALAVFDVLIWLGASYLRGGPDAEFDSTAAVALLAYIPMSLVFCLLAARALRDESLLAAFAVMYAATGLVFELAGTLIYLYLDQEWISPPPVTSLGFYSLYLIWSVAVVLRMQFMLAPWRAAGARLAAALLAAMVLVIAYAPHDEPFAVPAADDDGGDVQEDEDLQDQVLQVWIEPAAPEEIREA